MARWQTLAAFSIALVVGCLAAQENGAPCQDGICAAHAEQIVEGGDELLLSAISEHSSSDHLAYVQKKASKVKDHRSDRGEDEGTPGEVEASLDALTWAYAPSSGDDVVRGPSMWYANEGNQQCSEVGTQSPINMLTGSAQEHTSFKASDLTLTTLTDDCTGLEYILLSHTAELEYGSACNKVTWQGKDFQLAQFHYHSPSEHMMDGGYFPLEVHHVHISADGQALVIGVMVAVVSDLGGTEPSATTAGTGPGFLLDVIGKVPRPGDDTDNNRFKAEKESDMSNPYTQFIPDLSAGFFYYMGSFTTPPCTTNTVWIISPTVVAVPSTTIDQYRILINSDNNNQLATYGTMVGASDETSTPPWNPSSGMTSWHNRLGCNNRPIQALTGADDPGRIFYRVPA